MSCISVSCGCFLSRGACWVCVWQDFCSRGGGCSAWPLYKALRKLPWLLPLAEAEPVSASAINLFQEETCLARAFCFGSPLLFRRGVGQRERQVSKGEGSSRFPLACGEMAGCMQLGEEPMGEQWPCKDHWWRRVPERGRDS